jgi:5-methylthioribose kinase
MRVIDASNAGAYLRDAGYAGPREPLAVRELAGGVSNLVLRVSFPGADRPDLVLKQARARLRTAEPWHSTVERIWREVDVLRTCQRLLARLADGAQNPSPDGATTIEHAIHTPRVLFEDRENYLFAMTPAPEGHTVWKAELLAGKTDASIARYCGRLLSALHAGAWGDPDLAARLGDRQVFDELRLTPYYRTTARAHPEAAGWFEGLIESIRQRQHTLVHADFSPKNLLVFPGGLMLVDFETGHFGDAAFDVGFFLSHLLLKAFHRAPQHEPYLALMEAFWQAYDAGMSSITGPVYEELVQRAIQNMAGCAWARLDGTSKVDYLPDPARREQVRTLCRELFHKRPATWAESLAVCRLAVSGDRSAIAGRGAQ